MQTCLALRDEKRRCLRQWLLCQQLLSDANAWSPRTPEVRTDKHDGCG